MSDQANYKHTGHGADEELAGAPVSFHQGGMKLGRGSSSKKSSSLSGFLCTIT